VNLSALVERYAQFEKRGVGFYRGFAERFAGEAGAARLWREMSNTEASHFALLGLAQDWIAMAGGNPTVPGATPEALDAIGARMDEIEEAGSRPGLALADAVGLTVAWEELELPRILDLLPHLPTKAHGRVLAGMVAEAAEHYRLIEELARAAGLPDDADRVVALADLARAAVR
jgi:hypothetical protein